jgi:hypothetical protein
MAFLLELQSKVSFFAPGEIPAADLGEIGAILRTWPGTSQP